MLLMLSKLYLLSLKTAIAATLSAEVTKLAAKSTHFVCQLESRKGLFRIWHLDPGV